MKVLTTIDLLALPSLETPPAGHVGFGAKADGLYQKIGTVETKLSVDGHVHSAVTTSVAGFMSAADKVKLNGIATGANAYVHPTGAGYNHIPTGGAVGQFLKWSSSGVAVWAADNNTVYTHPATHPATIITEDASHRFVTDTEKSTWNAKSNLALGTTSTTAYRGDLGAIAYNHSQSAHDYLPLAGGTLTGIIENNKNGLRLGNRVFQGNYPTSHTGIRSLVIPSRGARTVFNVAINIYGHSAKYQGRFVFGFYKSSLTDINATVGNIGYFTGTTNFPFKDIHAGIDINGDVRINMGNSSTNWGGYVSIDVEKSENFYADYNNNWGDGWTIVHIVGEPSDFQSIVEIPISEGITGNALTATTLQTTRTINGTNFDGSANITTANWGTARNISIGGTTKSVNGSAAVTWATSEIAAQTAVTLATARTLTIGNTGKTFNGTANVSWSAAEIGAAGLSGGMPSSIAAYNPYWVGRDGRTNDMRGTQRPYVINHHTGISLSAHSAYSGIRLWLQGGSPYDHDGTLVAQFSTAINHYVHTAATTITATGTITAPTFSGALSGNAATATTATKLGTATVGSTQLPFYLNAGTATACTSFGGLTGIGTASPLMDGTVAVGTSTLAARQDHRHATDTSRAAIGQTMYIGTTAVTINRTSAVLSLTGIGALTMGGALSGVTTLAMTGALSGATTIAASTSVTTPKVIFAAAGWSVEQSGTEIQFKYNGVIKQRLLNDGSIVGIGEITAFGSTT